MRRVKTEPCQDISLMTNKHYVRFDELERHFGGLISEEPDRRLCEGQESGPVDPGEREAPQSEE